MDNNDQRPVLFMAGGTGGHVFPALACATALKIRGVPVHWLGTLNGLEAKVIPQAGINISYINVTGLRGKGILTRLLAPFRLLQAVYQAAWIMWQFKPRAVLGMGGFASGPGGLVAWLFGIPLYIHEQNAKPGLTNRILSKLSLQVMQAFPDTFPAKVNAITTGNPLRFDIIKLPKVYQPQTPLRLLIIGGSLGASIFNETLPKTLEQLNFKVQIWHQTGRHSSTKRRAGEVGKQDRIEPFINDMSAAYDWADLVICRAGAMTVSELAQVGLPSILVPYPHAVDDHQTHNAAYLVAAEAAILLPQTQLNPTKLAEILNQLGNDSPRLTQMAEAARGCAKPDAVDKVLEICLYSED